MEGQLLGQLLQVYFSLVVFEHIEYDALEMSVPIECSHV